MLRFFKKQGVFIGTVFVLTVGLLLLGYYAGYSANKGTTEAYPVYDENGQVATLDADFNLFWEAWDKLRNRQVSAPNYTDQDFVYGGVEGLAGTFDDPYTIFLRPTEAEQFEENVRGNFGGIGAEIGLKDERIVVVSPLEDSPAQKAGLLAGDAIVKIDGASSDGMSLNEAIGFIRGEIGTEVVLSVYRDSWLEIKDISIVRDKIVIPTLGTELYDDGKIMRIALYAFNENAPDAFYKAANRALSGEVQGLVLDLRNNPGGYLEVATELAGWFLDRGTLVVSEKFRSGEPNEFLARGNGALKNLPVVILINQGSASASEILAGALRDQRGVPLVGQTSFGKGTVQELVPLSDGSSLKVTIANWVLPKGHVLTSGLVPDYTVEFTQADVEAEKDVQLDKALEVLRNLIAG